MRVVLTIGTTHPLNVAGLGLVARVAGLLGVRVVTIVAGVSAQNATTILGGMPIDDPTIAAQFEAVRAAPIDAIHVGALLDARSVAVIARELQTFGGVPVVCDPVGAVTGGVRLADDATIAALRDLLFQRCTLVTPNLDEAALLLDRRIADIAAMESSARELRAFGARAVLVKGGHLDADPADVLATEDGVTRFSAKRIPATLRGTGDLLAGAIAARLAYGDPIVESVAAARAFVRGCLAAGVPFAGTRTVP